MIDQVWTYFLTENKHHYLNNEIHLIHPIIPVDQFEHLFDHNDRKKSLQQIKQRLVPSSYKNFLNKYRVYKSRKNAATIQLSVSKYNLQYIDTITKVLGYQSNNETLELLCSFYAEHHDISLAMAD